MGSKQRVYRTERDSLLMGTLRIEEPAYIFREYGVVAYIKSGTGGGFFADLETTKDIIAQLAAIVAEHEKRKPALQVSITGDDFRV